MSMKHRDRVRRLAIVTSVVHYRHRDVLSAYGPYVREIEMWADLFPEIRLAAPLRESLPPGDCLPIRSDNVRVAPKIEAGGQGPLGKLAYLWKLPLLAWQLIPDLVWSDAVHVRNPGNLGLIGVLLTPLFKRRMVSKYAGQWISFPGEPFTVRLQKRLLASRWWRGPVTVYGEWDRQPSHVIPFFSSAMSESQLAHARIVARSKTFAGPLRVLYVGRLSRPKNVDVLLQALAIANSGGANLTCTIIGTGSELDRLQDLARDLEIDSQVEFRGGLRYELVLEQFEQAHILVLVSESEGWPKAVMEGMAYGLVCIGSNRGLLPQLLGDHRGFVVPAGDAGALASVLLRVTHDPQVHASLSASAAPWAQKFSLEHLRDEIRTLLERTWGCQLGYTAENITVGEATAGGSG